MNRAYRHVWSVAREAWVMAAEIVQGRGGRPAVTMAASAAETDRRARRRPDGYPADSGMRISSHFMALEPRFMFDAAGVATVDAVADRNHDAAAPPVADKTVSDTQESTNAEIISALTKSVVTPVADASASASGVEVAFVDARVPDIQTLLAGIKPGVKIFVLDPDRDGVTQVTQALRDAGKVSAIHIVSHGAPGDLFLGATELNSDTLAARANDISAWRANLTENADVLIYGCDVAKGSIGQQFVQSLSNVTGADVAASGDKTGAATLGGNWVLETVTGPVEAAGLMTAEGAAAYQARLSTISLSGGSGWTAIMYGASKDPDGDSQAGAADTDIIGDSAHGSLYTAYDDNGTATTTDDYLAFRMRIDNPTSSTPGSEYFGGVGIVGMDANQDGRVDLFMSVDGRNNTQAVRLLDPGTDANISPSTTSTSPLPTGWLPNNGIYPFSNTAIYNVSAVSAATDPNWGPSTVPGVTNAGSDLTGDGKTDVFVSWKIPVADLAAVLAKPSPTDRSGVVGPRGTAGIAGFTKDTTVQYVNFTQTQPGPINGDLNGVGANYDKNGTFASLGAITAPMTASNPVPAGPTVTVTEPISGGVLNDAEDNSVTISGTSTSLNNGTTISLTVSDGTNSVSGSGTVSNDAWSVANLDLSGLNDGTLTVTATYNDSNAGTADPTDTASVLHDKTPPAITIDQLSTAISGTPTFTGTTDLPVGSQISVTIDPDNNSGTSNSIVYQVVVGSGGVWSLNTATATPTSGTLPNGGLYSYSKVTATATDSAGNSATATAINHPTVNTLNTNDTTPAITGTWTNITGDTLTVAVNGTTYTAGDGNLAVSGNAWTLTIPGGSALGAATYPVTATVTRGSSVSDTTDNELTITNTAVVAVDITGGATASGSDPTPSITGTSSNAGGFVIVRLDPSNDGDLSDAVTYSVTTAGGAWTLDTGSATPISGTRPSAGFIGANGILATDSTGAVSDTQVLTVTTPSIAIGSITSTASSDGYATVNNSGGAAAWLNITEDNTVTISGTATTGFTVDLVIVDASGNSLEYNNVAVDGSGNWSATNKDLSSLDNGTLTVTATLTGTSLSATNTSVTHDKTAPQIYITAPSPIKKTDALITGRSDLPSGTNLTVQVYDGATQKFSATNVVVDSTGYWSVNAGNIGNAAQYEIRAFSTTAATDAAGNISQQTTKTISSTPNASVNSITIQTIAGDVSNDVILVDEIGSGVSITGITSSGLNTALTTAFSVTVTDGVLTKTATVNSNSSSGWNATLATADVKELRNGPLTVIASVNDGGIIVSDVAFPSLSLATPTLTITDNVPGTASGDVTFTFQFSEGVTDFDTTDITVNNGSKGTFTTVDADTYTLVVSPTSSSSGDITVSVNSSVATGVNTGRGNADAGVTQAFNTTGAAAAPTVTINTDNLASDTTPVISGTTSLSAGAPIVITIDSDNDGDTDLTYSATVQSGGTWSLDIGSVTPTSGTLPADGLATYAKVTATATNAYGNSTSAVGLNKPSVTSLTTNDSTPTLTGAWTQITGDTLSVVVNGVTYSVASGNLNVTATGWSLTPTLALADNTYSVTATVDRSGTTKTDVTSSELTVDTLATVTISGGATADTTADSTPLISGTSSGIPAGTVLTLNLDTDNDGDTDIVYKTTVQADGSWSVDTGSATPYSGTFPGAGLSGPVLLTATATDPAGNVGTDTQTLTVDVTPPVIAITSNSKTPDTTPLITGTTDLPAGSTLTIVVDPDNVVGGTTYTYTATVQTGGTWSVDTTTAVPGGQGGPVTYTLGNTLGVTASGSDAVGNSASASKAIEIASAPTVTVTEPIGDGDLSASEDDAVVIQGSTTGISAGSTLAVTITDGTITIMDTATVAANGTWQLAALNLSGMANGVIAVTAAYTEDTGDTYADSASVLHDKAGTVTIDSISSDTGVLSDFITRDQTLVFSGSATAGANVQLALTNTGTSAQVFQTNVTANGSGVWTYDYTGTTLAEGTYSLQAVSGATASQNIVIDTTAPTGPVTVVNQATADTTPTITGTATVGAGESLSVSINGQTYTVGDGNLTLTGGNWTLTVPATDALTPASADAGFNGVYSVTATIKDTAGNMLSDSTSNELTIQDTTAPVIDLDPSNGSSINHSVTSANGAAVSLDDNSDAATVVEASDKLNNIAITVAGLQDGANEKLIFGSTTVAANGTSGSQSDITVGGVRVNVTYTGGVFTIQKYNYADLTAAEVQAVIRDIQYQNVAGSSSTAGSRTFAFGTTDDAGNASVTATTTVSVTIISNDPPTNIQLVEDISYTIPAGNALSTGLGGSAGLGELELNSSNMTMGSLDDTYWQVDVSSVFPSGFNFFGTNYSATDKFFVGSNGYVTFDSGLETYDPSGISGVTTPMIAAHFTDIDISKGGNIYVDRDSTNGVVTITYKDVAPYETPAGGTGSERNSYQIRLYNLGTSDFGIEIRYADVEWAKSGSSAFGTAGWTAGDTVHYGEVTGSGTANLLTVESASNLYPSQAGVFAWEVRSGAVQAVGRVNENAAANTPVSGSLFATDPNAGDTHTFTLVNDDGGRFTLSGDKLYVASGANLDYETQSTRTVRIRATDQWGASYEKDITITLNNLPEVEISGITDDTGTAGDFITSDANLVFNGTADPNSTVTLTLKNASNATVFTQNVSAGVNGAWSYDYSSTALPVGTYTLTATTSVNGIAATDSQAIQVTLSDTTAPVVTSGQNFSYAENQSANAVVGTVAATDAVGVTGFRFSTNSSTTSSDDYFTIAGNGQISITAAGVAASVAQNDYETTPNIFTYGMQARDAAGNWSTAVDVTLNVTNVNDNAVSAITDSNATANSVAENAANGTVVGVTALATDGDSGATISYSLTDNAGGRFAINAATGVITVADGTLLDYEAATSHTVTVLATSSDGSTNTGDFTIAVTNVNDNAVSAITDSNATANSVAENAANGTVVGVTALATDGDSGAT
ncbi:MAG: DUF4347 domain-containing protein, partial [Deltaproteobacteria bacterium]|nr:DUF4347 domain-containing protein [Deltaproteobacteria bacterium]